MRTVSDFLIDLEDMLLENAKLSPKMRERCLRFLNRANCDIFLKFSSNLPRLQKITNIFPEDINDLTKGFILPDNIHFLISIWREGYNLKNSTNPVIENLICKESFIYRDNKLFISPKHPLSDQDKRIDPSDNTLKPSLTIRYVPVPKQLVLQVTDADTQTNTLEYPETFYSALLLQTLSYSYLSSTSYAGKELFVAREMDKNYIPHIKEFSNQTIM